MDEKMKKNKRRNQVTRIIAVLLVVCMLPIYEFSDINRAEAAKRKAPMAGKAAAMSREITATGSAISTGPAITEEPEAPSETPEPEQTGEPSSSEQPEPEKTTEVGEEEPAALVLSLVRRENGTVTLQWNLLPCEEGDTVTYQIYRDTSLLDSIEGNSYTDTLAERKGAAYLVTAYSRRKGEILAESNKLEVPMIAENLGVYSWFTLEHDMVVKRLLVDGALHLNGHKLTVQGDVNVIGGNIYMEAGFLECEGNFSLSGGADCRMEREDEHILVHGDFAAGDTWGWNGLKNGTLEVKGDFSANFRGAAEGPIRVILSGEGKQRVRPGETSFAIFDIQNKSDEGVVLERLVRAAEFHSNGCRVSFEMDEGYRLGWTLYEDQVIEGDLKLFGDTLDLNGHTLTVKGNIIQPGGTIEVNGGSLIVEGDYGLVREKVSYSTYDNFGKLVMQKETDYVRVEGNFINGSSADTEGFLTNGVLELKGTVTARNTFLYGKEVHNFFANGGHTVVLSGDKNDVKGNGRMTVQNLELRSTEEAGINIAGVCAQGNVKSSGKKVSGVLEISRSSQIEGGCYPGSLLITEEIRDLTVKGDLHINGAAIAGEVIAEGDFYNEGSFTMDTEDACLKIGGSYIQKGLDTELDKGIIDIKGDFQIQQGGFLATGRNKVILSGTKKQNIINTGTGLLWFQTLELTNTGEGVDIAGPIKAVNLICNDTKVTYGGQERLSVQILKEDMVIEQGASLTEELDLNGHCLTIKGDLIHMAGQLKVNGGRLIVEGNYRQQTVIQGPKGISYGDCDSSLVMQDDRDLVKIDGSFFTSTKENTEGLLTNGTLEIHGDIKILSKDEKAFQPSEEHRLVLKSGRGQRVDAYYISIKICHLLIENSSSEGVYLGLNVQVTKSVEAGKSIIGGEINLFPSARIEGNYSGHVCVKEPGELTGDWNIGGDLRVFSKIHLSGTVTVGQDLYIYGSDGEIIMEEGSLLVKRDARFRPDLGMKRQVFTMSHEKDYFCVGHDWDISTEGKVRLSAGVTQLKGNLYGYNYAGPEIVMEGTHRLLMGGKQKQVIQLNKDYSNIHIIELKNPSEEGVWIIREVTIDQVITNGYRLYNGDGPQRYGWTLTGDQVVEGDLSLLGGELNLNGYQLTVKGNLTQGFGDVNISGGRLVVEKDYRLQKMDMENKYVGTYNILSMKQPEDYVLVKGSFIDECWNSGSVNAGTLEIQGNYQNLRRQDWTAGSEVTVIFSGEQEQKAWSEHAAAVIPQLEIKDKKGASVEFGDGFIVKDTLRSNGNRVDGTLCIYGNAVLDEGKFDGNVKITRGGVLAHEQEINGDITILCPFTLKASLKVNGNIRIQKGDERIETDTSKEYALNMTGEGTVLTVEGSYTDESGKKSLWEKGSLRVKGDVRISPESLVEQKKGHKLILDGDSRQVLDIGNLDAILSCLELRNIAGVDIASPIRIQDLIQNGCPVTYGGKEGTTGWTLERNQEVEGDLLLIGGLLDLKGHTLTVKGSLEHLDGTIRIHGGRLVVEGDYNLRNTGASFRNGESFGTLRMEGAGDDVLIEGDMYVCSHKDAVSTLKDGVLELKGSFRQSNSYPTFSCSGNHTVLLSGRKKQEIDTPFGFHNLINRSKADNLQADGLNISGVLSDEAQNFTISSKIIIRDPNEIDDYGFSGSLLINKELTCSQDLTIRGFLELEAGIDLNGHTITAGSVKADRGTINLGGGRMKCWGDFQIYGDSSIIMKQTEDYLLAGGHFFYGCQKKSVLTAGTLELRGRFLDYSGSGFRAEGEHRTILNPPENKYGGYWSKTQISFSDLDGRRGFHILLLYCPEEEFIFSHPVEELCDELRIYIHGIQPPKPVTGLRAEQADATGITLVWDAPADRESTLSYEIYRNGVKAGVSENCRYEDTGLSPETTYIYQVYALDEEGGRSEASEELLAGTRQDQEPPEAPGNLLVYTRTGSSVTFNWDSSRDNVKTAGYEIYRNGKRIEALYTGTVYKDTKAVRNGRNVYEVTAVDTAGNVSEKSGALSAVVAMPRILGITPADGERFGGEEAELVIRFQDVGNSEGNTVSIARQTSSGEWVFMTKEPLPQEGCREGELCARYIWDIREIGETGEVTLRYTLTDADGNQTEETATYQVDRTPPVAPGKASVDTDNGTAVLRWSPSISADCVSYGGMERTEYDGAGNAVKTINSAGEATVYTYDAEGKRTSERGPDGGITKYRYYPNGKLQKVEYADGRKELYTYNRSWQLILVTDGSQSVSYEYDGAGRVTAERDGEGNTVHYGYDKAGNRVKETDANGNVTEYAYDGNGNCIKRTNALGFETEYKYDGENRLIKIKARTKAGVLQRTFVYDAAGRLTEMVDEEGNRRRTEYDRQGRVTVERDALGAVTAGYIYDSLGRIQSVMDASGMETAYVYDAGDRLKEIKERGVWSRSYDKAGRLTETVDPLKGVSRALYDKAGRLMEISNPGGGTTHYTYDGMGRLTREEVFGNGAVSCTYGPSGQVTEKKNGRGQKTEYTYDRAGRIISRKDTLGEVRYTYDGNGNILTETDQNGTVTREYDCLNRVIKYTDSRGRSVDYGYDELGNVITLTYPGGEIVRYTYYETGNIETVTDGTGRRTRYAYDGNGRLVRTERPDGTVETRSYDAAGRLTGQIDRKGTKALRERSYTYDVAGNITEVEEKETGSAAGIEASEMTYDANNRLVTWNGETVGYDADGNMIYGPVEGRMCELEYDCRNRLIRAGETRYEYDAEDVRTAVIKEGVRTELFTDLEATLPRVLLAEESTSVGKKGKSAVTRYVYGNGLISEESKERGYLLYHYDQVGNTRILTDQEGEVKRRYTYGPYGELEEGEREGIRFLYNGRYGVETDGNGLYYMRARYYSPEVRRFINQDVLEGSVTDSRSLNRYAYVQGNPLRLTDPFGLSPMGDPGSFGHSLLGLLGAIPGAGEIADGLNAIWYFVEGDNVNGWLSLASALPGIGSAAGQGLKLVFGNSGRVLSLAKLVQDGSRLVGYGVTLGQTLNRGIGTACGMYEKYYVRREKAGVDTVLEAGSLLLDMVTCAVVGKSIRDGLQEAVRSFRTAGQELAVGYKGGSQYDLYRKTHNTGEFKQLQESMTLKNVKRIAKDGGINYDGIKISIDRSPEVMGKGYLGYTWPNGKRVTLYPDAFSSKELLVKTLGHERMHVYQIKTFGAPQTDAMGRMFENAAYGSEKDWWKYFQLLNGGN